MQAYFKVEDVDFFACGLSLVMHPKNPMVPTVHANWRYFEMYDKSGELVDQWFGGGLDLTPYYLFEEDAEHFHLQCKNACDRHNSNFYQKYKQACDAYFYNSHRKEARGGDANNQHQVAKRYQGRYTGEGEFTYSGELNSKIELVRSGKSTQQILSDIDVKHILKNYSTKELPKDKPKHIFAGVVVYWDPIKDAYILASDE